MSEKRDAGLATVTLGKWMVARERRDGGRPETAKLNNKEQQHEQHR